VTWPTNTFLEAVAWRNHPPAEGTPATVANAVGNLNRVRQLKRNAQHPHRSTGRHGDDLWAGPLTDDVRARSRYGRSARQLRRLLQAVLSGA
jgi:hypothetical protein